MWPIRALSEEAQNQPENFIGGDDLVWTKSQGHRRASCPQTKQERGLDCSLNEGLQQQESGSDIMACLKSQVGGQSAE